MYFLKYLGLMTVPFLSELLVSSPPINKVYFHQGSVWKLKLNSEWRIIFADVTWKIHQITYRFQACRNRTLQSSEIKSLDSLVESSVSVVHWVKHTVSASLYTPSVACFILFLFLKIKSSNAGGKQATDRNFLATKEMESNCEKSKLDSPQYFQKNTKPGCLALELALDQFSLQKVLYWQWWAPSAALWL